LAEWFEEYTPKTFEDVLGQADAVEQLSRMIREGKPRNVMIAGPSGSGKTTLANIYARAILCEAPTASGSPCGVCASCEVERPMGFRTFGPERLDVANMRQLVETQKTNAFVSKWVFLLDDADKMREGYAPLHGILQKADTPAIFIFTLIDRTNVKGPVRSRLAQVEVAPASPETAVECLRRICIAEEVSFQEEGLRLLVEGQQNYREATNQLQTIASAGPVDVDAVQRFRARLFSWLVGYFGALAEGDLDGQIAACRQSPLEPSKKAALIVEQLACIKRKLVGPTFSVGHENIVIPDELAARLVGRCAEVAGSVGLSTATHWNDAITFWATSPSQPSPEAFEALLTLFHDLVHGQGRPGILPAAPRDTPSPTSPALPERRRWRSALSAEMQDAHLSFGQVAEMYEAATFALQAGWRPFNCKVRLVWSPDLGPDDIGKLGDDFSHQLDLRLKTWTAKKTGFDRIRLNEQDAKGRFVTTLVGHVPPDCKARADAWFEAQKGSMENAEIEFDVHGLQMKRVDLHLHWRRMRELWRGVDPTLSAGENRLLAEVLQIPGIRRRPSGAVRGRRFSVSGGLGQAARASFARELAPHESAVSSGEWSHVYSGWEWPALVRRQNEVGVRSSENGTLLAQFGESQSVAAVRESSILKQKQIDRVACWPPAWTLG